MPFVTKDPLSKSMPSASVTSEGCLAVSVEIQPPGYRAAKDGGSSIANADRPVHPWRFARMVCIVKLELRDGALGHVDASEVNSANKPSGIVGCVRMASRSAVYGKPPSIAI